MSDADIRGAVIHRDLKPSNVMVGAYGEVQVMDWGLAKVLGESRDREAAVDDPLATVAYGTEINRPETGSATRTGSVLGTPAYMPPEQAGGEIRKLDAHSDVFGLGAILCQILTGQPPYRGKDANENRLKAVRWEMQEAVARLDGCGAEPELVALCQRCLAFKQGDRPADGNAVAQEVARIRQAAEERARRAELERAEALVREAEQRQRRRVLQWAAGAIAAVLLLGIAGTAIGLVRADAARRAEQARADSEAAAKQQAEQQRQEADNERDRARRAEKEAVDQASIAAAINEFLQHDLLRQADASAQADRGFAANPKLTVRELLDRAATRIGERFKDRPRVEAAVRQAIGNTYCEIGEAKLGVPHLERGLSLSQQALGGNHADTLGHMHDLALTYHEVGELDRALQLIQRALALAKPAADPARCPTQRLLHVLAVVHLASGRPAEAIPIWEKLLKQYQDDPENKAAATIENNLGLAYQDAGQPDMALPFLKKALAKYEKHLTTDHPLTLNCMHNLGTAYGKAGQLDESIPLLEKAWSKRKQTLEPGHPFTLRSQMSLATAYSHADRVNEAVKLLEDALTATKAKHSDDHLDTLTALHALASAYQGANRLDKAQPLLETALEKRRAKLGVDHPDTLTTQNNLATLFWRLGQLDKSIPLFEDAVALSRRRHGADHPNTLHTLANLGVNYRNAGRHADAIPCLEEVVTTYRKRGPIPANVEWMSIELANTYSQSGQPAKAEPLYRDTVNRRQPNDPTREGYMSQLSLTLLRQHKFADAEPVLREVVAIRTKLGADDWTTFNARSMLGEALSGQKKYTEAEPLLIAGYEGLKQRAKSVPAAGYWLFDEALERLVRHNEALGKKDEAAKWRKEREANNRATSKP